MSADGPIHHKFNVERTDGSSAPGQKHDGCEYFVLDLTHDPAALAALFEYAVEVEDTHPKLAADLRRLYLRARQNQISLRNRQALAEFDAAHGRVDPGAEPSPKRDYTVVESDGDLLCSVCFDILEDDGTCAAASEHPGAEP